MRTILTASRRPLSTAPEIPDRDIIVDDKYDWRMRLQHGVTSRPVIG